MSKKSSGLGRGLGSLIPPKIERPAAETAVISSSSGPRGENQILHVPVSQIVANPQQPRSVFRHRELEELTNSIREHGIIQPLVVSPLSGGGYELIAGERRLRAAKLLNLPFVPVIVRSAAAREKLLLALIENVQRQDLSAIEEAVAYSKLAEEFGLTQEGIAQKVGKARSTVANTLRLLELPPEIQQAIGTGELSAGNARAILGLKDDKARLAYFRKIMGKKTTTREAEAGVRKSSGGGQRQDPAIAAAEEQIRNVLGAKVEIKKRGAKGSIMMSFYSEEEYQALVEKLQGRR
ncbi:MAG: ParB/RepB/Spo0J family partition protein [Patescibacteria group bacterium]|jgi:ParB family chromosome partitioning protein